MNQHFIRHARDLKCDPNYKGLTSIDFIILMAVYERQQRVLPSLFKAEHRDAELMTGLERWRVHNHRPYLVAGNKG